jgi:Ni/Co efflux regulator RcnB
MGVSALKNPEGDHPMNKLLSSAAVLCLVLAAPAAIAQSHHGGEHHSEHHGGRSHHHGSAHHGDRHEHRGRPHHGSFHGAHRHHDWSRYRRIGHASHRYHAGHFRWPHDHHYRHWRYGEFLPSIFFGSNYWLRNWSAYGLYAPPSGLVWVRYGPDAMLVDRYTGEVVRVQYGVFY